MNKTAIKNFAIWARNKLIADISYRAGLMGITADGIQNALPQSTGMTEFYDIGTAEPYSISGDALKQRKHLVELIRRKEKETNYKTAYKYVLEEVAYTWFNRLIAVRFMEVNDYLPSHIRVLSSDSGKMEPDLVTNPVSAGLPFTSEEEQVIYQLKQENKVDDVFRILFIKQCNTLNENLPALFEKTSDYTELLLNLSVIDQDGVVYHLVHDIPEEDFNVERGGQVEIIGWMYQYYNTEPKNEAFAKKGKITKEEVPAVTQLFTPDWIVRYMVENSLGRLWVEGHPNNDLKAGWKYYLEEAEQEPEVQVKLANIRAEYAKLNPEDIKVIDPCMGSGHILVYAFDVLMQIYESAGYGQRDAARSILENNLYGLDIDDRAFQMAYFAVMMKARQYNRRILNGEYKLNVYSIQESNGIKRSQLKYFGAGLNDFEKNKAISQIMGLLDTFKDAKEYGSILMIDHYNWDLLDRFVSNIEVIEQLSMYTVGLNETAEELKQLIAQGKIIAQKYHVTLTNPPYMGLKKMTAKLTEHVIDRYPEAKADLATVFIVREKKFTKDLGYYGAVTQHGWMFQSTYESLRGDLQRSQLISMLHLGTGAFEEISGEVVQTTSFVFRNNRISDELSQIFRLVDSYNKEQDFLERKYSHNINLSICEKMPNGIYAYWLSEKLISAFDNNEIERYVENFQGIIPGKPEYLYLWHEIESHRIDFEEKDPSVLETCNTFYPYAKGGSMRRWYGNNNYVLHWFNGGRDFIRPRTENRELFFKDGISWSDIKSGLFSARFFSESQLFDAAGPVIIPTRENIKYYLLGFMNTKVFQSLIDIICQGLHYGNGAVTSRPLLIEKKFRDRIDEYCSENIKLSKIDWDAFEESWDYKGHNMAGGNTIGRLIADKYKEWELECEERFNQLKANEEELNRIFIEIYGLQDELTPEVEDKDVTVRKAELQRDIKSLLSYAVGCMFGRYSLDVDGLAFAGGEWDASKYVSYIPDQDNVIPITDEEYLEDDMVSRLCSWLKVVYGKDTLEQNLDFIASALGKKGDGSRAIIRNYFLNDFFKDHCQTYSVTGSGKRPIYWLFDSGKQNGFKALIYLHRYTADTIGNLRIDYLHRMQRIYESEISRMQDMIDHSTNAREVAQATKRREKLQKQLKECRDYDEKIGHLALSRIELDLDDGVKKNYRKLQTASDGKLYEVLADSKSIMAKEK